MASQQTMEAATRESRANAREDMAVLTSGAREKVDRTMASAQALGQQLLHPFDKHKRVEAQSQAEEKKQAAAEKRDEIRTIAAQQAQQERIAARARVAETMSSPEGAGSRYPSTLKPEPTPGSDIDTTLSSTSGTRLQHPPVVEQLDGATASTVPAHPTSAVTTHIPHAAPEHQAPVQEAGSPHEPHLDRMHEFKEPSSAQEASSPHEGHLGRMHEFKEPTSVQEAGSPHEHHPRPAHESKEPEHAHGADPAPTPPGDQGMSRDGLVSRNQAPQPEDVPADRDFYHTVELVDTRPSV